MLKAAIFDLDGTLVDSSEGITNSVRYAEAKLGLPPCRSGEELQYVGLPLVTMYAEMYKLEGNALAEALEGYREYYLEKGHKQLKAYEGIPKALKLLKSSGIALHVATSKREHFTTINLEDTGLRKYFGFISCSRPDDTTTDKKEIVARAIAGSGCAPEECIMVGDRIYDVEGAHGAGTKCIMVTYGFGGRGEAEACRPDFTADTPIETARLILQLRGEMQR